jgi:hypothetical protein
MVDYLMPVPIETVSDAMDATEANYTSRNVEYILRYLMDEYNVSLGAIHEALQLDDNGRLYEVYGENDEVSS